MTLEAGLTTDARRDRWAENRVSLRYGFFLGWDEARKAAGLPCDVASDEARAKAATVAFPDPPEATS